MAFGRNLRQQRALPKNFEQFPADHWDRKADHYRQLSIKADNSRKRQYATEMMIACRDAAAIIRKGA